MPTTYRYLNLDKFTPPEAAALLWMKGYRQVSRRWGHISRVDVSDDVIRKELRIPADRPLDWRDYDYCRRCMSKDVVTNVPPTIMMMLRRAGGS